MEEMAKTAVKELGLDATVVKITDIGQIAMHGIMSTPGLIINGKIKHSGKPLPSLEKVKELIQGIGERVNRRRFSGGACF
jgi:hypothetical protein